MNSEVMKRRIAAMLCCAVLTAGMPMGALAEGETQAEAPAVQEIVPEQTDGAVQTDGAAQTYKKFKLKPELVEGVLCVSVSGASVLDVQVRVLNAKGETVAKQTVVKGTGTAFFADLMPGVYTLSAAYADKDAAAAVKAVSLEYEIIDEEAVRKAAEEEALKKAAEEEALKKAAEEEALKKAAEEAAKQTVDSAVGDSGSADEGGAGEGTETVPQAALLTLVPATLPGGTDSTTGGSTPTGSADSTTGDSTPTGSTDSTAGGSTPTDSTTGGSTPTGSADSTTGDSTPTGGTDSTPSGSTPSGSTDSTTGDSTPSGSTTGTDGATGGSTPTGGTDSTPSGSTDSTTGDSTPSGSTTGTDGTTKEAGTGQFALSVATRKGAIDVTVSNALDQDIYVELSKKGDSLTADQTVKGNGTVSFTGLAAGTYTVYAEYYDVVSGTKPVEVSGIELKESAEAVVEPEGKFSVETSSNGKDSITAKITGAKAQAIDVVLHMGTAKIGMKTLTGDGEAVFTGLAAGTYTVLVTYQETVEGVGPVTSGEITLSGTESTPAARFAANASVSGSTISVEVTGASRQSVEVKLSGSDGVITQSRTLSDGNGKAEFTNLAADTYTVTVDYAPHVDGVDPVIQGKLVVGSTEPDGQFTAKATVGKGTIDVTVSGALAKAVGVELMKPDGTSTLKTIDTGNGTASFTGLMAGTYSFYADYMDPVSGVKAVEQADIVVAEGADIVEIVPGQFEVETAAGSNTLTVTVSKANKQTVEVVLIKPDNTTDRRTLPEGNGTVTYEGLAAGDYGIVVAYQAEVSGVSAVKREGITVSAGATAGAIVATAKAGVNRVDVTVSAASKLPVAVTLLQNGVIRDSRRIEAGVGSVAFEGLAAGTYSVSIDYAPSQENVKPYVIDGLNVTASIAKIAIAKVQAGENKLTVTGTAQPDTDITVITEPASSTAIVHSDAKGAFTAEITCSAGTYTAVHAQYGADTASRVTASGTFTVTTPETAPTISVDRIVPSATTVVAKTSPGVVVNLATSDYGQTVTADSRGVLRFYLPHTYAYGTKITFTVFYGTNNSKSYVKESYVTDERYYKLLRSGSNCWEVFELTTRLAELGYPITPTYKYTSDVVAIVKLFQANNGLTVDGIAGKNTHDAAFSVAAIGYSETTYPTLVRGDRGLALIYSLQQRLKDLGYYTIRVDGIFGSGTQRAVRDFQANNGLTVTGRADNATQKLLYSSSAKAAGSGSAGSYTTLARSNRYSSAVVTLQRRLKALGYLAGAADGYFGSQTYRAVRSFQSANGLSVTGIADPTTQALLFSAAAKAASGSSASTDTGYRLLYWGCKGDAVKRLQQALLDAGYKQVRVADGIYGQWTYDAVRAFQKANGLSVDGIAGKNTQNKLYGTSY